MNGRINLLFILLLCILIEAKDTNLIRQKRIVGGIPALQPPEDDPVVFVNRHGRNAQIIGSRDPDKGFYTFRGIRFGQPPTGPNRFQRATPVRLEGDINATAWGPPCPQLSNDGTNKIVGSEDCLFLNVFTPSLPDLNDGYPVLIWIHGGGFTRGSACQYEMRNLINKKMVVVSIQYRLGSLGFLSTGTKELPGNNGMFDMILAIDWVKDYIHFFGGNPSKVIAFGHGTGASSAMMLSLSKFCKDSFSGLIAMSGSILSNFAIDKNPFNTAKYIARKNDCPTDDVREMVNCLRELPVEKLIEVDSGLEKMRMTAAGFISGLSMLLGPGPVIEGSDDERSLPNFITESPEDSLKLDHFPSIPLLTGVMNDEVGGAIFGKYKDEVLKKLNEIPDYLTSTFIPSLQETIPNMHNGSQFFPQAFLGYLNVLKDTATQDVLKKVVEALGDSLYNAPAFLTLKNWSKKAKAFLYSFDHKGKKNYGKDFLAGSPTIDTEDSSDNLNHGDDLGYIFNRNTITGEKINDTTKSDEEDERVTEIFTGMISDFARNGALNIPAMSENSSQLSNMSPTFSDDTNSFISIMANPKSINNFRYCEMGLWTGVPERLKSPICTLFKVPLQLIKQGAEGTMSVVKKPINTLDGLVPDFASGNNSEDKLTNTKEDTKKLNKDTMPKKKNETPISKIPRIPFTG